MSKIDHTDADCPSFLNTRETELSPLMEELLEIKKASDSILKHNHANFCPACGGARTIPQYISAVASYSNDKGTELVEKKIKLYECYECATEFWMED